MSKEDFKTMVKSINRSPIIRGVSDADLDLCWDTIDDDKSGYLEAKEFYDVRHTTRRIGGFRWPRK